MVMDHFYQLPLLGPPEHEMFEAYTLLGALAARTRRRLGTLVTGVTYRNPALLAKEVTSLDVISQGRAFLGIGTAWFDAEHDALGFRFPPTKERFERLEEALQICGPCSGRAADVRGHPLSGHGRDQQPRADPAADRRSSSAGPARRRRCGWSPSTPTRPTSPCLRRAAPQARRSGRPLRRRRPRHQHDQQDVPRLADHRRRPSTRRGKRNAFLAARGLDWDTLDDATKAMVAGRLVVGDADTVSERIGELLATGIDGVIFNMPVDGHDLEAVARLRRRALSAAVS